MPLWALLTIVLALSGALFLLAGGAYRSPLMARHRLPDDKPRKVNGARLYTRVLGNMVFSSALVYVLAYAAYPWLFDETERSWAVSLLQPIGILLLYDAAYYCMHRFAFHRWAWLKRVHAVHHAVRHANAIDSLYLHPLETFLGLALLMACTMLVGPVQPVVFAVVFAVYSFLNILVHCGLDLPVFGLRAVSYLARKHDIHHTSMRGGNFASITPICDILFGTAE
ncbi:MAG: sterol desaturase family protein [Deltaproteobacteria bacterium]|nr:sterol desaturase family protein [Nannocystaceae bacterium]